MPDPASLPRGDGRVVLVLPAYMLGDGMTAPLRRFLTRCGFRALGWDAGPNWGPTPRILAKLRQRLSEACALQGGPVGVVGVSLGGVLARDLAYDRAADISHVVTLVSPFRLPTASTLAPLVRVSALFFSRDIDVARLATPLPVPSTAIYTREDGIVAWQTCRSDEEGCTSIEVPGPHLMVCRTPEALSAVVESLTR